MALVKGKEWTKKYGSAYAMWLSFSWGIVRLTGPDTIKVILSTAGRPIVLMQCLVLNLSCFKTIFDKMKFKSLQSLKILLVIALSNHG